MRKMDVLRLLQLELESVLHRLVTTRVVPIEVLLRRRPLKGSARQLVRNVSRLEPVGSLLRAKACALVLLGVPRLRTWNRAKLSETI